MRRNLVSLVIDGSLIPLAAFATARSLMLLVIEIRPATNMWLVAFLSDAGVPGYDVRLGIDAWALIAIGAIVAIIRRSLASLLGLILACFAGMALILYPVAVFAGDLPGLGPVPDTVLLALLITVPLWLAGRHASKANMNESATT